MKKYLKMYAPLDAASSYAGGGREAGIGSPDIDLDFTTAQNIAGQMMNEVENLKGELNKIVNAVDGLTASWQSNKATQAKSVCDEFTSTFDGVYNLIMSTPSKIDAAAKALQHAETGE